MGCPETLHGGIDVSMLATAQPPTRRADCKHVAKESIKPAPPGGGANPTIQACVLNKTTLPRTSGDL
jgi:hypothetical protein